MKKSNQNNLTLKVISDVGECQRIWNNFSRQETVWDAWELRKAIIDTYKHKLNFVAAWRGEEMVAVMPLWFNEGQNRLEWVSEEWTEGNYAFGDDGEAIENIRKSLRWPTVLEAVLPRDGQILGGRVIPAADHFGVDLTTVGGTWTGYVMSLKRKKRQAVKKDIRCIETGSPVVHYDRESDLEVMFDLNISRMREKAAKYTDEEPSTYEDGSKDQEFIRRLWKNRGGEYNARIICVEMGGRPVSCDFTLIYKNKYYSLQGGVDVKAASGIGSFSNKLIIDDAVAAGCSYVDFCMEDHHWKRAWFGGDPMERVVWENKKKERVAVIYNSVSPGKVDVAAGVTDEDTRDSARLVAETVGKLGYRVRLVEIPPGDVEVAGRILNMCEWSGKDSRLGVEVIKRLEARGGPFTGGTSESYAWGSDKIAMKRLFGRHGVPTPVWGTCSGGRVTRPQNISWPVIIKPALEHCSIGLTEESVVAGPEDLKKKAREMERRYGEPVLIEEFVGGSEYQVVVVEKKGRPRVLPPVETVYKDGGGRWPIVTFADNWLSDDVGGKVEAIRAADPGLAVTRKLVEIAERSWVELGCRGYVRLDIREKLGKPYVLEVNVNPGIGWDEDEDMRVAAEAAGWDLGDVIRLILDSAVFDYDPGAF
ncbi:GNAT family N-acetyltransferase [Candidatus Amesbacteria bacterium]|nr:GNAT family N-acetyltransferase [Candidatus Amesbacteria bacterium]